MKRVMNNRMRTLMLIALTLVGIISPAATRWVIHKTLASAAPLPGNRASARDEQDEQDEFKYKPWPNGRVRYKFDNGHLGQKAVTETDKIRIREEMSRWTNALTIADPAGGAARRYIEFEECLDCDQDCPEGVLVIRYNTAKDDGHNMCTLGIKKGDCSQLHIPEGFNRNSTRHELGHCLGMWHEFNREDADHWLAEEPDLDGDEFKDGNGMRSGYSTREPAKAPMLGNYDYDSIMHYRSYDEDGVLRHRDWLGNAFSRWQLDISSSPPSPPPYVSKRDKSRLFQYYAHGSYASGVEENWGFFQTLNSPAPSADELPDPYLAPDIRAVGSPSIAYQSPGNYDIFTRGSNNRLYWKAFRNDIAGDWTSLGCCYGSEPAAVSARDGELDVVAIGRESGKLIRLHYENGAWGEAHYVQGGYPSWRIKDVWGGYIGPAIASRTADSIDIFVVQGDGRLAVTTLNDDHWVGWRTLSWPVEYNVTARPAAVALSETAVRLAINEGDYNLYEPLLTFAPAATSFTLGVLRGEMAYRTPPALTRRAGEMNPYRVLITTSQGRIAHRFASGAWRDIGGIPKPGTGPAAVATGAFSAYIAMNGEDAKGCTAGCLTTNDKYGNPEAPEPNKVIQPGGLWLRRFR